MKNTIDPMELKQLLRLYYATTGRLLFWKNCEELQRLEEQILGLILKICGEEVYTLSCEAILRETQLLHTVTDCAMLKISDGLLEEHFASYYDMRADMLKYYDIQEQQAFDMDILILDNNQAIIDGEPGALRLGACMNWLGLWEQASKDAALRYWTVLAYTGDRFAMRALEYVYIQNQDEKQAKKWATILEIFREADRLFTITVPEKFLEQADAETIDTAQVILAVRRRCADDGKELLPIPLLQYAIDSPEDVAMKLQNLYAPPETYHTMLARQKNKGVKPVGFAF